MFDNAGLGRASIWSEKRPLHAARHRARLVHRVAASWRDDKRGRGVRRLCAVAMAGQSVLLLFVLGIGILLELL
eukprot:2941818-Pleurochrysis_carterae.AAC.1